jgi:hypothetical protein
LRIVTYNTANDVTDNNSQPRAGMGDILKAIGAEVDPAGVSRPVDVLALQESTYYTGTGINPTAQGFVNLLNSTYGAGTYAAATVNGTTDGNLTGNGPQTLIYNTKTVDLTAQVALGTPSGTGIPRQVMEYTIQPIGYPASAAFTLFNDHMKSGTSSSDNTRRGIEGSLLASTANSLSANSNVSYTGDYNPTNNASDLGYRNVTTAGTNNNQGIDPLNGNFTSLNVLTETPATVSAFSGQSTGGMRFRDDLILDSPAVYNGTSGLQYISGSLHAFGNTGTVGFGGAISSGNVAAFAADLPSNYSDNNGALAMQVLTELTQVADHLPVVSDYQILAPASVPAPASVVLLATGMSGLPVAARVVRRRGGKGT